MRDSASAGLSTALSTAINNDSDLNDQIKKAVRAMTNEALLAFRKAAKDNQKVVKLNTCIHGNGGGGMGGVATRRPGR